MRSAVDISFSRNRYSSFAGEHTPNGVGHNANAGAQGVTPHSRVEHRRADSCTWMRWRLPVCTENLSPGVVVVKSAYDGMRTDASGRIQMGQAEKNSVRANV